VTGAVKELLTPNTKEITAKVMMLAIGNTLATGRCTSLPRDSLFLLTGAF
jgi:hypothetical protein